jgi:anti-anti-sigma regulatory factor
MEIVVSQQQGRVPVTIFHVKGPITSNVELEAAAREALAAGTQNLLLDLAQVPYMATSGVQALNNIYTMLRTDEPDESDEAVKAGIAAGTYLSPHLKLLNPTPHVFEVLKLTGLDMFLQVHRDPDRAIASF